MKKSLKRSALRSCARSLIHFASSTASLTDLFFHLCWKSNEKSDAGDRPSIELHYYIKKFTRRFKIGLGGGQTFKPPQLMPGINRGGHFLLTEAVTVNRLAKSIYCDGFYNVVCLD